MWVIEGSAAELRTRITALVKELEPGLSLQQRERKVLDLMEKPRAELLRGVQVAYTEQRRNFGVCCFATDPSNVLMWSHYANRHKGVCLQYEFARDVPVLARALHVDYLDEAAFQPINWTHAEGMRDAIGDTLKRKHKRWEYEGEHRILLEGQAGTYLPVRSGDLGDQLSLWIRADRAQPQLRDRSRPQMDGPGGAAAHAHPERTDVPLAVARSVTHSIRSDRRPTPDGYE